MNQLVQDNHHPKALTIFQKIITLLYHHLIFALDLASSTMSSFAEDTTGANIHNHYQY